MRMQGRKGGFMRMQGAGDGRFGGKEEVMLIRIEGLG